MRKVGQRVPIEEAKRRALVYLGSHFHGRGHLSRPSEVGGVIWLDTRRMSAQGLGLAAVRILKLLEKDGLARWVHRSEGKFEDWGWAATSHGMETLRERSH